MIGKAETHKSKFKNTTKTQNMTVKTNKQTKNATAHSKT